MADKSYLVPTALAVSLGINATLIGAGLAEATTIPWTAQDHACAEYPTANAVIQNILQKGEDQLCGAIESTLNLDAGDCTKDKITEMRLNPDLAGTTTQVCVQAEFSGNITLD